MREGKKQYLLVGLGNPGQKYARTRHNIGFMALDHLADRYSFTFTASKWQASLARTTLWDCPVLLVKPETYMNLSGRSVAGISSYYRIAAQQLVVIHDDLDLPVGRVKIVEGRGAGGHNGIRSIIEHLGDRSFARIRVGIGRPDGPIPVEKYVLAPFRPDEMAHVDEQLVAIEKGLKLLLTEGAAAAMNAVNQK